MTRPLNAIVCEDSPDDYDLLVRALVKTGYAMDSIRVETAEAMRQALAVRTVDIVFSDWSMPHFSAPEALAIARETELELPFIIVSGTVGEEVAVQALRNGAHDFLVKDRLARLGAAVERELKEAEMRRERNKMREQLMISDRMASIGLLAAGVAHEINNPLAATIANLDMAVQDLERLATTGDQDTLQALREEILDAQSGAGRVRDIVRDLRIFARAESELLGPVDIKRILASTLRMASNEIRHRARLVTDFGDIPLVHASESRLGQVFLNLVVNAAQAIPEGHANTNQIRVRTSVENGWARVEIADTGTGLAPEIAKHLFTPFITTKPKGVGTGLGLSICHRIVTELGGDITADTRLGAGTTFVVRLPAASSPPTTRPIPTIVERAPSRRGRVLVVDDEPMITSAVQRMLGRKHDVFVVHRATDAIEQIERGERFDVILTDLMMPETTGLELHERLLAIAPDQAAAIVFMTGGAFTQLAREFLETVPNRRLEKPFEAAELRQLVNGIVG